MVLFGIITILGFIEPPTCIFRGSVYESKRKIKKNLGLVLRLLTHLEMKMKLIRAKLQQEVRISIYGNVIGNSQVLQSGVL